MSALVDVLDWYQDRMDWFVGPIGWLLPDRGQWRIRIVQAIVTGALVEIGLGTYGQRYLYGIHDVRGGEKWRSPKTGKWDTMKTSREIPRPKSQRAPLGRVGVVRAAALISMSLALPVALISNALLVAYSIPPDKRDPGTGLTSLQEYRIESSKAYYRNEEGNYTYGHPPSWGESYWNPQNQ